MCDVMVIRSEGPFVRHQISLVPKAGPDRVSSAGVLGGETQALRTGSDFCLHERGPWIPPTTAGRGRGGREGSETAIPSRLSLLPVCLSACALITNEKSAKETFRVAVECPVILSPIHSPQLL